ncbi:GyrI-like domain-containing protein [Rossellomorea aquimaris]|uniref:GyrI-like domain-containing protein n=1 Tax=Rossellomorea aquimaris TaxID=189382 RepID=UPI001CD22DE9|nr:GyrI-like domain-containing protein [Rossellomorea aquimaris]MCA1054047.1 GyrI-like domain-containing protein [Rossellomorea aquimaris]
MNANESLVLKGVMELEEKKLVGFRVVCEDGADYSQEIPKASLALAKRKGEINHLVEPVKLIGAFKASDTTEDDGYWSCFEVTDFKDIPEGMVELTVPQQEYAVLGFRGHASRIFQVYEYLHEWMEGKGYSRKKDQWTLEVYSKWTESEDHVELCDPVGR